MAIDVKMAGQWILTLSIGAAGGGLAQWVGFPAPYLTGPSIAVTLACLLGLTLSVPNLVRDACFVAIGLSMGSGVTPDVIKTMGTWPFAFAILAVTLLVIFFGCRAMLFKGWGFDMRTATLASSPGHLSYVLGLSSQAKADIPTISIIQSIRVMALTVLVPFAVTFMHLGDTDMMSEPVYLMVPQLLWLGALAAGLGWLMARFKVPAAFLLGGMLVSTFTHASGQVEGQIPVWLGMVAFIIMGSLIGTRFSNVSMHQLRKAATAGLAATGLSALLAILAGSLASWLLDLPLPQLLISFAPGGVEAMAAMAVIMDVDTTFVAAQHVFRLFLLTFLAPMMLTLIDRKERSEKSV